MPNNNDWNGILQGLTQGVSQVFGGVFNRQDRDDSETLYQSSVKALNDMINSYSTQPEQQPKDTVLPNVSRVNVSPAGSEGSETGTTITKTPVKMSDIMAKYYDVSDNLESNFGEYGRQKAKNLASYFGQMLQQPDYQYMDLNGHAVRINKTNGKYEILPDLDKVLKPEKPNYTVGDFSKMSFDDVMKLNDADMQRGIDYFNEDTRKQLLEKYPVLQQQNDKMFKEGDFAPKLHSSLRSKVGSIAPLSSKESDLNDKLEKIGLGNANWNSLNDEDRKALVDSKQKLADNLGISVDELNKAAEDYVNAKGKKEQRGVTEDIQQRQSSVGDIVKQLGFGDWQHNLYMIDTSTDEGIQQLNDAIQNAWNTLGDNYNSIDESVIPGVYKNVLNLINQVLQSKGLPLMTLSK